MSWRRRISILAILGVLLHATALVRHNGFALASAFDEIATAIGVQLELVDCGKHEPAAPGQASHAPAGQPAGQGHDCPVCAGMASSFALATDAPSLLLGGRVKQAEIFALQDQRIAFQRKIRPPSRAPPVLS